MYLPPDDEPDLTPVLTKQQFFRKYLHYNPLTGEINRILTGRWDTPCFKPATFTFHRHENTLSVQGKNFSARALVWCYMTGHYPTRREYVVSKDNNCKNLRFQNLQIKTRSEVMHQVKLNKLTLGARLQHGKYSAKIGIKGKQVHLGTFDTEQEARIAYMKKKIEVRTGELR